MSALSSQSFSGDGCIRVNLNELIGLRCRVGRSALRANRNHAVHGDGGRSHRHGRGMDYDASRVYQWGDDVRRLDWRLTARSGKLHTKLFQEEREGRLLIVLDQHPCMRFGTRSRFKSVQAARAAALAAWHAVKAGERVGLLTFGDMHERLLQPCGGVRGALAVCGALAAWDALASAGDGETLSGAIQRVRRLQHGISRVLLLSDGWSCDDLARSCLLDLSHRVSIYVMVVADALELNLPPPGCYPFEYARHPFRLNLISQRERRAFQTRLGFGPTRLQVMARSLALPFQTLETAPDPFDAVLALLSARGDR